MSTGANMYDQIKAFNKTARAYGISLDRWVDTGIWIPPTFEPRHATGSLLPIADIAKKVRETAARRNMPFVQANATKTLYNNNTMVRMDVPKQNRTLKLVAPLIVMCDQVTTIPGIETIKQQPRLLMMSAEYRFFFTEEQFINLILKEMTNTQSWRAAMRLPVKVIGNPTGNTQLMTMNR